MRCPENAAQTGAEEDNQGAFICGPSDPCARGAPVVGKDKRKLLPAPKRPVGAISLTAVIGELHPHHIQTNYVAAAASTQGRGLCA